MVTSLLPGLFLAGGVAAAALRLRALTGSGAVAATVLGALIYAAGGLPWTGLLLVFFVTSSLLSRLASRPETIAAKSGRRDAGQVLANGGIAGVVALAALLHPATPWALLYAGSLAAAAADTWATEIGKRSRTAPRLITTLRRVLGGTSGGVSAIGLAASLAGSGLIAVTAAIVAGCPPVPITIAGIGAALVDSVLGATVQEVLRCPLCNRLTEQHVHAGCGAETLVVRGIPGLDNDVVNALATGSGATLAWLLAHVAG